jgi:hypothetical protein
LGRYYFHIRDGWNVIPDEEGMELSDIYAARAEAYASADDLAREALRDGTRIGAWAIVIADQSGKILGRVKVMKQKLLA